MFQVHGVCQVIIQLACSGVVYRSVAAPEAARVIVELSPAFLESDEHVSEDSDLEVLYSLLALVAATSTDEIIALALDMEDPIHHLWIDCAAKNHGAEGACRPVDVEKGMEACSRVSSSSLSVGVARAGALGGSPRLLLQCLSQRYCSPGELFLLSSFLLAP